ncbi:hypothetical protein BDW59DRAFT_162230 [Aspergillus cavernicola]|uniref:AAA+ ATPase lid domain-containing protein n=1 Tax=Aspergillus cavernicola TaxID=176166 RepID=A0ABR4IAR0_9EURO
MLSSPASTSQSDTNRSVAKTALKSRLASSTNSRTSGPARSRSHLARKNGSSTWRFQGTAQLNGRDIRNALQMAITLAETECEEDPELDPSTMAIVVEKSHFERVMEIGRKFHDYVRSSRREDERKRAAGRMDRNDYWDESTT